MDEAHTATQKSVDRLHDTIFNVFANEDMHGKKAILAFLRQHGIGCGFIFKPEAGKFLENQYSQCFKSNDGYHDLGHIISQKPGGEFYLRGRILLSLIPGGESVAVQNLILQCVPRRLGNDYFAKDPNHEFVFPISLLQGIEPWFNTKIN